MNHCILGLCKWVINIMNFNSIWKVVEPKRKALNKANNELSAARNKLTELRNMIKVKYNYYINNDAVLYYYWLWFQELERQQQILTDDFDRAVAEKTNCQIQARETASRIDKANRLVNGLASENNRWKDNVIT